MIYKVKSGVLLDSIENLKIHMVGIKGTGMTALAEILKNRGAVITGSDSGEKFYTDQILKRMSIPVIEHFSKENITRKIDLVVYSSAYSKANNEDLIAAFDFSIPCITYFEALGMLSRQQNSSAVSGVHGKTTTTAMVGTLLKELEIPATVITGSQVPTFDNSCTISLGNRFFIAEACEYKRQFLFFHPDQIIITAIELDHPDYYHSLEEIYRAFKEYAYSLPEKGILIYNADDKGTGIVIQNVKENRKDIRFIPYGRHADGRFQIVSTSLKNSEIRFCLKGFDEEFCLAIPGEHNILNATAAIALSVILLEKENMELKKDKITLIVKGLRKFRGTKRRSELLGNVKGVIFLDDYAHHPTAVAATLKGYKDFFPGKKIIVDFMPHTYSRTKALLHEFGTSFSCADEIILHKIYASARETNEYSVSGEDLYNEVRKNHLHVYYFHEVMDSVPFVKGLLQSGVLFVTMGAGDNWKLGQYLYKILKEIKE